MLEHRAMRLSDVGTQSCETISCGNIQLWDYQVWEYRVLGTTSRPQHILIWAICCILIHCSASLKLKCALVKKSWGFCCGVLKWDIWKKRLVALLAENYGVLKITVSYLVIRELRWSENDCQLSMSVWIKCTAYVFIFVEEVLTRMKLCESMWWSMFGCSPDSVSSLACPNI